MKWLLISLLLLLNGCTTHRVYVVQICNSPNVTITVKADVEKPLDISTDATIPVGPQLP